MDNTEAFQYLLFNDCSTSCEAYAACGGYRPGAPCGCIRTDYDLRYQCETCNIICRERKDFSAEVESGSTLDQVNFVQTSVTLPNFIPSLTHSKFCQETIFTDCVAVSIRDLFNSYKHGAKLKPKFSTEENVRRHFHVGAECTLMAVLNGEDWRLESLWTASRMSLLKQLHSVGFTICTAPTFSLTSLTVDGIVVPYSHHTIMLMRHHRVLLEIASTGLLGIPNLYWLDDDKRELKKWAGWLRKNPGINCISKDFTSTRKWHVIEPRLTELLSLLHATDRKFHILIIGSGGSNASKITRKLTDAGHSVSIVTSAPILKGIRGGKYHRNENGTLSDSLEDHSSYSLSSLINHNLSLFKEHLDNVNAILPRSA